jgi:hypothetical protein
MNQMRKAFACAVVCASLYGCGGGNSEIKPLTSMPNLDPKVIEERHEAMKKESAEKAKAMMNQANPPNQANPAGK